MSSYGNVPEEDVAALNEAGRIAVRVSAALPPIVPGEWRDVTYEMVLGGLVRDWAENGVDELGPEEEEDLTNLVRVAADVAMEQPEPYRGIAFRTFCHGVLLDWIVNWNGDDEDDEFKFE